MTERDETRREEHNPTDPDDAADTGPPTTGGSAPGGEPTGLRRGSGVTSGGAAGMSLGGTLPTGAGGDSGTGAGGLGTGMGGAGGGRNIVHGAGRPSFDPTPLGDASEGPTTTDTTLTAGEHTGAMAAEASSSTGSGGVEPESSPDSTVRGAGSGRV